jgi:hypothetical protein
MLRLNAGERLAIQLFDRANHEKNTAQHRDRCTDGKDNEQLLCGKPIRSTARLCHLSPLWSRQAVVGVACMRQSRAPVNLLISQDHFGQCAGSQQVEPRLELLIRQPVIHQGGPIGYFRIVGRAAQQLLIGRFDHEVGAILIAIVDTRSLNARFNLILFRLAACCGLRVSEVAQLNVGKADVGKLNGRISSPNAATVGFLKLDSQEGVRAVFKNSESLP